MSNEIIVNSNNYETRLAVIGEGNLQEIYIERPNYHRIAGNIYKGRVSNVLPGMQASFISIGLEKNAFLYVDDALPSGNVLDEEADYNAKNKSIKEVLRAGQEIIVQITKEPMGTKGARVTSHVTLPGRFLVLMPTVDHIGISRRIEDQGERKRLKKLAKQIKPDNMGLIVRTVAEGISVEELERDCRFLVRLWNKLKNKAGKVKAPALLHHDLDLIFRIVRDIFNDDVERFIIDDHREYKKILEILSYTAPHLCDRVFYYSQNKPIFETFGIESEIRKAVKRKVWLKCGGYLIIDKTEALTVIDVNTGKFVGNKNLDDTILKTNLEAAQEIARQLRLRDIGGIIVVDFIDMSSSKDQQKVLDLLNQEFAKDRTKVTVLGITQLGLIEITRKRVRHGLSETLQKECPCCEGTGRVISEEAMSSFIEQELKKYFRIYGSDAVLLEVHPAVAAVMIGSGGSNLKRLERETSRTIFIRGSEHRMIEDWAIISSGSVSEVRHRALPVDAGDVIPVTIEERHQANSRDGIARIEGYVLNVINGGNLVGKRVKVEVIRAFRTYGKAKVVN